MSACVGDGAIRQNPFRKSFGARWDEPEYTGKRFLENMARVSAMDDEALKRLEKAQR